MSEEICFLTAAEQRAAFIRGDIAPSEVLQAQLERIHTFDPGPEGIGAITEVLEKTALEQAHHADERYARARVRDEQLPALLGITVATKEKHGIAGLSLSQGLLAHQHVVATENHPIVDRLQAAGAIIHARTTSPEFSCATVTHSPMWGVTRNPFNRAKSPGGSSGGSAAALAAGFTTLATASDIAGSTRIPAAFTGTVGYKAPYGRVPGAGYLAADWYRGDGPLARTVADTALLTSIMAGAHRADVNSWGAHGEDPLPENLPPLTGIRFGLSIQLGDYPVAEPVVRAMNTVVARLRAAGAEVQEVELPWTTVQIRETYLAHFGQILAPAMQQLLQHSAEEQATYTKKFIHRALQAAETHSLIDSLQLDNRINAELNRATEKIDILLCPTNAMSWLEAEGDYLDGITLRGRHLEHYWEGHMTSPFNICNQRAVMNIPIGIGEAGIPIGMQIVGQPREERKVFAAAQHLEELLGFDSRATDLPQPQMSHR